MTTLDTTTPTARPAVHARLARLARPLGARTWLRTLHLLADMPLGIVAGSTGAAAIVLSVGLVPTLVGVPLVVLTLVAARAYDRFERARVRVLLGVELAAPAPRGGGLAPRRWLREVRDPAGWKALLHALLALPLGIATGTVTLVGWSTALALLATPVSSRWLPGSSSLGPLQLDTPAGAAAAFVAGVLLTTAMPTVVRALAVLDAVVARILLAGRAQN